MGGLGERSSWQIAAYVAAAALVLFAAIRYLGDDPPSPPEPTLATDEAATDPGAQGRGERLHVHVAGAVRRPGLYRLAEGSRVGAAIHRAGGTAPAAALEGVNLAAEVQDGQQVLVPKRGAMPAPASAAAPTGTTSTTSTGAPAAPVSLAQATPEQLDAAVDGIGPVLAASIIEYRDEHGSVESIDELAEVDGIGETRIVDLREALVP